MWFKFPRAGKFFRKLATLIWPLVKLYIPKIVFHALVCPLSKGARCANPALLTKICMDPNLVIISFMVLTMSFSSVISHLKAYSLPCSFTSSLERASIFSILRPKPATYIQKYFLWSFLQYCHFLQILQSINMGFYDKQMILKSI